MSEILANKLSPSTGTSVQLGDSGDTFNIPSGVTLTNSGTMNASAITAGTLPIARGGTGSTSTTFVNAATNITGNLPVANLNGGSSASSSTFWRGDGAWAAAGGAMTLLSSTDLSSGVSEFRDIDFFTTYSSYKHFILDVQLICPSSNSDLRCVFKDGSGDVAGNIQAAWVGTRNNASDERGGINTGSNSNGVTLFQASASNNGDAINGTIEFWQPVGSSNGDINMKWSLFGGQAQQNYWLYVAGGGTSESGTNATGFGIQRASGNLTTSGNYSYIKVYGVQST